MIFSSISASDAGTSPRFGFPGDMILYRCWKPLRKYDFLANAHKYKHNFDYVLTINMMNNKAYMTNGSIVLSPNESPFAGISNLNYAYYEKVDDVTAS